MYYCLSILFMLFFGHAYALNIVSILLMETSSTLENLIIPLTCLDNILSNNVNPGNIIPKNHKHASVLSSLFCSLISSKSSKSDKKYIHQTFESFRKNKTNIRINLGELDDLCENKQLLD